MMKASMKPPISSEGTNSIPMGAMALPRDEAMGPASEQPVQDRHDEGRDDRAELPDHGAA
jgi:hypothetical protein